MPTVRMVKGMSVRRTSMNCTPKFWTKTGSILTVPGEGSSSSSYTGIKSIPMGDLPGLSEMKVGSMGACQYLIVRSSAGPSEPGRMVEPLLGTRDMPHIGQVPDSSWMT